MDQSVEDIIDRKRKLIAGLEDNIFKNFTEEEELLLHSKHGRIKVLTDGHEKCEGITGAFKCGLPLIVDSIPVMMIPKVIQIDWDTSIFQIINGDWFSFEFVPIKLTELKIW